MRTHTNVNTTTGEVTETPMPYTVEELKALIAEKRWQRETGGCEVLPGVVFPTTRDVRVDLSAELSDAEAIGENYSNTYVIGDLRIPVTLEMLRSVNAAVREHVRSVFSWQAGLLSRIEAGEDIQQIAEEVEASND